MSRSGWASDNLYDSLGDTKTVESEHQGMDSALLQNLMAGAGSSSQFIGGLVVAMLYVVIGLLGAIGSVLIFDEFSKDDGNRYSGPRSLS